MISRNQVDNSGNEEDVYATPTGDIIPGFVKEIQSLDLYEEKYHISIDGAYEDENHD